MPASLIVALDVPTADKAAALVDSLPPEIEFYKVGLELFVGAGPAVLQSLHARRKRVFLDLKLHDIPNTVAQAVTAAARHGVRMLTVHASGGRAMIRAAADAAAQSDAPPAIVAVTTLTSLGEADLQEMGLARPLTHHTLAMGELALQSGANGLVCSPLELQRFRAALGPKPLLVTPGIRPAHSAAGDQKRIATPAVAVRDGSSFLVVGRPITQAPDPAAAARAILAEMQAAHAPA